MRLPHRSSQRLKRLASRHGWTASDASARLVEEGLRRVDFAFIDFRDSLSGREAYVQGSSLTVWEVMLLARAYNKDAARVARHLRWPQARVQAAFNYAAFFPGEIDSALSEQEEITYESLARLLPQTRDFRTGSSRGKKCT